MKIWTYAEAKLKVQQDMDTEEETFIEDAEYVSIFNEAIDHAEAQIHNMNQDYFLTFDSMDIVSGQKNYDMPSNIYANKLRLVQYNENERRYKIERIKIREVADVDRYQTNDNYMYNIVNSSAIDGTKFVLYPTPNLTRSDVITRWYLRNANRVEVGSDVIDIPEFINYIFAFVKWKIALKELNPLLNVFIQEKESQEMLMKQTLDNMIPDEDSTLELDLSHYDEMNRTLWEDY